MTAPRLSPRKLHHRYCRLRYETNRLRDNVAMKVPPSAIPATTDNRMAPSPQASSHEPFAGASQSLEPASICPPRPTMYASPTAPPTSQGQVSATSQAVVRRKTSKPARPASTRIEPPQVAAQTTRKCVSNWSRPSIFHFERGGAGRITNMGQSAVQRGISLLGLVSLGRGTVPLPAGVGRVAEGVTGWVRGSLIEDVVRRSTGLPVWPCFFSRSRAALGWAQSTLAGGTLGSLAQGATSSATPILRPSPDRRGQY